MTWAGLFPSWSLGYTTQPFPALGGSETPAGPQPQGGVGTPLWAAPCVLLWSPRGHVLLRPPTMPGGCLPGAGNLVFQVF